MKSELFLEWTDCSRGRNFPWYFYILYYNSSKNVTIMGISQNSSANCENVGLLFGSGLGRKSANYTDTYISVFEYKMLCFECPVFHNFSFMWLLKTDMYPWCTHFRYTAKAVQNVKWTQKCMANSSATDGTGGALTGWLAGWLWKEGRTDKWMDGWMDGWILKLQHSSWVKKMKPLVHTKATIK